MIRVLKRALSTAFAARRHAVVHAAGTNLVIVGLTTTAGIVISRTLGVEGRGYYAAIMAWFAFAQVLGELGQSGSVTFWVARASNHKKDYVASSRVLMLIAGGTVSALGILMSGVLAQGVESVTTSYRIAFFGCLLNSICAASVYALQSVSIKRWNVVRLCQPVAYVAIVWAFSVLGILDIIWLSVALVLSIAAQFTVAMFHSYKVGLAGGRPRRALLGDLARYGTAYAGSAIPASLSSQFDRLVLSRIATPTDLGQYAVASSVASLAFPFSTAVASVVFPQSANDQLSEMERRHIERRAIFGATAVSAAVSVLVAVAVAPLIPFVFGQAFSDAVGLVWWIVPAILFRSISQVIGALLRGRHKPGLVTYGQLLGLAVGAVSILPFTNWLGIRGAASAVSLSELTVLAVALALLRREQRGTGTDRKSAIETNGLSSPTQAGVAVGTESTFRGRPEDGNQ
ncbi:oligosaccharide flippase family protein [Cryobacterium sp. TMT4-10]|uniref:oligosaccharide flippase family protein n=1 Tax=Cryobacterium sp. TMT4-10 TaxID=1259256 RepID=UPI00106AC815|nr:oligosaccharide flippase family protein [Cryobacterium sp. TMT4-10]TFD16307.1 hypothetical protein E3T42_09480 [Cryobacterium sp. TMT4-10]